MFKKTLPIIALMLMFFVSPALGRTWTDYAGRTIEGTFFEYRATTKDVVLALETGKTQAFPFSSFSIEDQEFVVDQLRREGKTDLPVVGVTGSGRGAGTATGGSGSSSGSGPGYPGSGVGGLPGGPSSPGSGGPLFPGAGSGGSSLPQGPYGPGSGSFGPPSGFGPPTGFGPPSGGTSFGPYGPGGVGSFPGGANPGSSLSGNPYSSGSTIPGSTLPGSSFPGVPTPASVSGGMNPGVSIPSSSYGANPYGGSIPGATPIAPPSGPTSSTGMYGGASNTSSSSSGPSAMQLNYESSAGTTAPVAESGFSVATMALGGALCVAFGILTVIVLGILLISVYRSEARKHRAATMASYRYR